MRCRAVHDNAVSWVGVYCRVGMRVGRYVVGADLNVHMTSVDRRCTQDSTALSGIALLFICQVWLE